MTDNSYKNWHLYSDEALEKQIGIFIKAHRQQQKKTQQELADAANISRSTLSLLERGETVTLSTLIQVLRVLDLLHLFEVFQIKKQISPLALAKEQNKKTYRVRKKKTKSKKKKSDW